MLLNLRIRKLCIHSYVHVLDVIVYTVILKREKLMVELTLYAVHCYRDDLDRKISSECCLGPKDHYEHVTRIHEKEGLVLKGLIEQGYLDTIIEYMKKQKHRQRTSKIHTRKIRKSNTKTQRNPNNIDSKHNNQNITHPCKHSKDKFTLQSTHKYIP